MVQMLHTNNKFFYSCNFYFVFMRTLIACAFYTFYLVCHPDCIFFYSLDSRSVYTQFPNVSEVTENLLLCSAFCVNQKLLDTFNIACIINAALELPYLPPSNSSIKYHQVPIMDVCNSNIYQYLDEVADLIHEVSTYLIFS